MLSKKRFMAILLGMMMLLSILPIQSIAAGKVRGDLDGDGEITSIDFGVLRRYLLGGGQVSPEVGDLDGDGTVNSIDFGYLRKYLLGIIHVFPADEITPTATITPTPENTPTPEVTQTPSSILPPVNSVDANGPFSVAIDKNTGPSRKAWVIRPASLGSLGVAKHPIFIFGPGSGSTAEPYQDILTKLASHGFVVFSEQPSNSGSEMKAGIDWLIEQNSNPSSPYYNKLDTTRIGAGGHSLGSVAAYGVASDSRITTTFHIDGGSLDGSGASKLRKPTALVCGTADNLALGNTRTDYKNATVPIWYGEMIGVDHGGGPSKSISALIAWCRWHLAGETERKSMFIGSGAQFGTGLWQSQYKNW